MSKKTRLELTWIGKDEKHILEPRILLEDQKYSFHADKKYSDDDFFDNRLIFGDNLLALKALEQEFTGLIKCVYIDPPYNTGNAFEHYDDSLEHSIWLNLMKERLQIIRTLLSEDGFICVHIDESEGAYLKVLMDEIFGRSNYLTTLYIQVRYPDKTLKEDMAFHKQIEHILVYRKSPLAKPNKLEKDYDYDKFCYYIEEKGTGKEIKLGGKKVIVFNSDDYEIKKGEGTLEGLKEIWASGSVLDGNSSGRFFRDYLGDRKDIDGLGCLYKVFDIGDDGKGYRYFTGPKRANATRGKYYQGVPIDRQDENEENVSYLPILNFYDLASNFGNCRHEGGVDFKSGKKPEILIQTILKHFSNKGDWVLDSFAGSGTTGAVAHKMGRKWIMIELKEHCLTHIVPRLKNVISGKDQTGISQEEGWKGGGGFRFYNLAPSLLQKDKYGNWIISKEYNAEMLAEGMCKLEGFNYNPNKNVFWKHGQSTETDYIYVTTQLVNQQIVADIVDQMEEDETLLICCKAFNVNMDDFPNVTLKKIPQMVLNKCEFGRDDYSLNVEQLPVIEKEAEQIELFDNGGVEE
ncbi:site-specific DNA-methyltransferase [Caldibacillus lycopersici]|uniref:Site-specific DNA-methyltransferase n=1 Tax=Perspicuibacillus lycopersici TaxID=1325689 RepID=A0AAE3ISP7_9BACI|nr:site-specific DNA-methyltransferase [Perspicuibacillus lycopersici]MCU9612726.1 site-specific DNA-methyltransferase [Perspicuibacillus lycopersici]